MNTYNVEIVKDLGGNYAPAVLRCSVPLAEAVRLTLLAVMASFGEHAPAVEVASMAYTTLRKRSCAAWSWTTELRTLSIRIDKVRL